MRKMRKAEGISFQSDGAVLHILGGRDKHHLTLGQEVVSRIAQLDTKPCTADELAAGLLGLPDGMRQLAILTATLRNLVDAGYINLAVMMDGEIVAQLCKKGHLSWREGSAPPDAVISPHVVGVQREGWVVLDSGLGCGLVKILPAVAGFVLAGEELAVGERFASLRDLLWQAGLLASPDTVRQLEHTMWNPVELLMMERSNDAAANIGYGATYRYPDMSPPPLVEPIDAEAVVALPAAEPKRWEREDESFGLITERRRSVSIFSADQLPTLKQLAGVFHRSARFQQRFFDNKGIEVARRPASAGGALHELDLYVVVDRMTGLEQGLWRYNPAENTMERLRCRREPSRLVDSAAASIWTEARPPVTVIVVARFARVMWKYEGVGASLVLKNTGVLLHALQLAAVAEGLGACPLGSNSAQLFEEVTGLGFPTHGPVGQLVLGVEQKEQLP